MNYYGLALILLFSLLLFIFSLRGNLRQKIVQRMWIERMQTTTQDNHTLWSMHVPYFQNLLICKELQNIENQFQGEEEGASGSWKSRADILQYPSVKKLFRRLMPYIESYSQFLGLDKKYLTISAWASVDRKESNPKVSQHQDALFSGCYYLQGVNKSSSEQGGISFFKKSAPAHLLATFKPDSGDFLLFPADMVQNIHPHQSEEECVSIHFKVYFGNKKKSWVNSSIYQLDIVQKLDPFHESTAQDNISADEKRHAQLFHTSKIKRGWLG